MGRVHDPTYLARLSASLANSRAFAFMAEAGWRILPIVLNA